MNNEINILKRKLQREMQARKDAETLLEEKSSELYQTLLDVKDSENILKSALSSMNEGLLLTNMEHKIILCNKQLKNIYSEWAYMFHKDIDLSHVFEPYIQHPSFLHMLEVGRQHCSFEINLFDGKIISVHVLINKEGVIASTHQDVTSVKAVTREQQNLLLKLLNAQKMEAIGKMSGTIAHDFNNIIAAIKGYASFLDEDIPEQPVLRNSVDKIIIATEKAENLVKQILDYSNQQKQIYQSVSLDKLLQECVNLTLSTLEDRISIHYEDNSDNLYVKGNESQLNQVIMNLLSNARDAVTVGKGLIKVSSESLSTLDLNQPNYKIFKLMPKDCYTIIAGLHVFLEPCVRITVSDNGLGMPKNILKNTFELFFSTKNIQKGSGFGMYSVANIITEHAGGIKIYSKPGFGTICEVVFLMHKKHKETQHILNIKHKFDSKRDKSVLLVDDDEEIGLMLHQVFSRSKIKAHYVNSGKKALKLIHNNPSKWNVILCDQMMPGLKGTDILKNLRDNGISIPFIIHSGHIEDEASNPHLQLADHIIKKPTNYSEIINILQSYL
jgi:signal transduction histidine kinase/CheY-like chemotaxis protein